jgi:hypothetical protein
VKKLWKQDTSCQIFRVEGSGEDTAAATNA